MTAVCLDTERESALWDSLPDAEAIAERAAAWRGTSEMALESRQQGGSFLSITRTAWPHPDLAAAGNDLALPVAVALATAAHGIALEAALEGYLHAFTANLISAAVRSVPLGQSDGQIALASLEPAVRQTVAAALAVDDLVAILDAGAYGSVMASNYNRHLLPAEVLVDGGRWSVIRRRQTLEDVLALEQ